MPSKKQSYSDDEVAIYDDAVIYLRGNYWQFRMWLAKERKYARFSLKTRSKSTAIDKAQLHFHSLKANEYAGKTYFSLTTAKGVEKYLAQRKLEVGTNIVAGRLRTIKIHLEHWLEFIGRDTKLKELERTDCENYYLERNKGKNKLKVSSTTVANEQSTINALMAWLYKRNETYIDGFDFTKLPPVDKGLEANRRNTFTAEEVVRIRQVLEDSIAQAKKNIAGEGNLSRVIVGYYLLISLITGLRKGEQVQLTWDDVRFHAKHEVLNSDLITHDYVQIRVRGETSKVKKTRWFLVPETIYFDEFFKFQYQRFKKANKDKASARKFADTLLFSTDGVKQLTPRSIAYHFDQLLDLADIESTNSRNLVPYSFRHYYITDWINRGATPTQVAETCGTSTTQIEKTYYHTTEARMIGNAFPNHTYQDGMLVRK